MNHNESVVQDALEYINENVYIDKKNDKAFININLINSWNTKNLPYKLEIVLLSNDSYAEGQKHNQTINGNSWGKSYKDGFRSINLLYNDMPIKTFKLVVNEGVGKFAIMSGGSNKKTKNAKSKRRSKRAKKSKKSKRKNSRKYRMK